MGDTARKAKGTTTVKSKDKAVWLLGIAVLLLVELALHWQIPFMMDDLWYSTNLATGEALQGIGDIIESQIWHFLNWGGRCMTHAALQVTLMWPQHLVDVLNLGMTVLLGRMICVLGGCRRPMWFLAASSLLVTLNANVKMSMFWQAGAVNYVYSAIWIFVFLWAYIRQMERPEASSLPLANLWMLPIGLLAGWSNENMGPVCFLTAVAAIVYIGRGKRGRLRAWMWEGAVASLVGSVLVIAAPGNFSRSSVIEYEGLAALLGERLLSMMRAGTKYLFPSAVLVVLSFLLYVVYAKGKTRIGQWMLLAVAILSFGAMVLSPHYPDRATFGTMAVCIALSLSLLSDALKLRPELRPYMVAAGGGVWVYALQRLAEEILIL